MSAGSGFSRKETDKTCRLESVRARLAQATPPTAGPRRPRVSVDWRRSAAALVLLALFLLGGLVF